MEQGALEHALAIAAAGRLQEADGLADDAVDRAIAARDAEVLLAWLPLSVELCDALGRPSRAVHVLGVAASFLRSQGSASGATSLEVDAAVRATAARLDEWRARLEQALARVVDEGAVDWGVEAVLGLFEVAGALDRGAWVGEGALRLARQWAPTRAHVDAGRLAAFAAVELETAKQDPLALQGWTLACDLAASAHSDMLEGWNEARERCAGRLLSRG